MLRLSLLTFGLLRSVFFPRFCSPFFISLPPPTPFYFGPIDWARSTPFPSGTLLCLVSPGDSSYPIIPSYVSLRLSRDEYIVIQSRHIPDIFTKLFRVVVFHLSYFLPRWWKHAKLLVSVDAVQNLARKISHFSL